MTCWGRFVHESNGRSAHVAVLFDALFAYLVFAGLQVGQLMRVVHH